MNQDVMTLSDEEGEHQSIEIFDKEVVNNRKGQILLQIVEMGMNASLAQELMGNENININEGNMEDVVSELVGRIIQREEELESLELIKNFGSNITINSFTQSPQKDKYGPKLMVQSSGDEQCKESCMICIGNKKESEMQKDSPCGDHKFCLDCVRQYLINLINCSQVEKITCPFDKCPCEYSEDYIKGLIQEKQFEKYKKFKRIKTVSKDPNVRWCFKIDCQGYGVGKKGESLVICQQCKEWICFECGRQYHQGMSCQQIVDQTFQQAIKTYKLQLCPQCRSPIQKLSGCNHMQCVRCRYQFCWLCRMKYHSKHYKRTHLLACYGGQFSHQTPSKCPLTLITLLAIPRLFYWILLFLFLFFRFALLLPIKLKLAQSVYNRYCSNYDSRQPKWKYILYIIFLSAISIITFPINIILTIIPGTCIFALRGRYY